MGWSADFSAMMLVDVYAMMDMMGMIGMEVGHVWVLVRVPLGAIVPLGIHCSTGGF